MAVELGLKELGIRHEAERKAELGLKKMAHSDGDGTWHVARGSESVAGRPIVRRS